MSALAEVKKKNKKLSGVCISQQPDSDGEVHAQRSEDAPASFKQGNVLRRVAIV